MLIFDGNDDFCPGVIIDGTEAQQCGPLSLTVDLEPGRYLLVIFAEEGACGAPYTTTVSVACPWDLDGSGDVGITDFLDLLAAWGPNPGHPADFDDDGFVGITDFLLLLANWGPCP